MVSLGTLKDFNKMQNRGSRKREFCSEDTEQLVSFNEFLLRRVSSVCPCFSPGTPLLLPVSSVSDDLLLTGRPLLQGIGVHPRKLGLCLKSTTSATSADHLLDKFHCRLINI